MAYPLFIFQIKTWGFCLICFMGYGMIIWRGEIFFVVLMHAYTSVPSGPTARQGRALRPQKNNKPEEIEMNMEKQHKTKPGAIFHFDCKVHGRSTGANAIRLAAYRAGSRLRSDLTGRIHNYTRKREIYGRKSWRHLMLPPGGRTALRCGTPSIGSSTVATLSSPGKWRSLFPLR